jgi:hypothetical protein
MVNGVANKYEIPKDPNYDFWEHKGTEYTIYYDHDTGARHDNEAALKRFKRLHWGGWIRPRMGRHKHLWRKPTDYRWWARQHVLCNREQGYMLEEMITPQWKKPRHFIDDEYEPYHVRHGMDMVPRGKKKVAKSYVQCMYEY